MFESTPHQPLVLTSWHNRLAMACPLYTAYFRGRQPERRMAAMVSASKDGAFLSAILQAFEIQPIRGSSSRRGSRALRELSVWARKGYDVALTPDGPRGPKYKAQDGALLLGQLTGLPLVPVGYRFSRKWTLRSWDAFQIPFPFARCDVIIGPALHVPRKCSAEEREILRGELETRLLAISQD